MWISEPQRPGEEPALPPERPHPRDVGDAGQPADDRDVAVIAVAERRRRLAGQPPPDRPRRVRAALDPALGDARHRPVLLPRLHGRVADDEDLGMAGDVRSGPTRIRPARSLSAPVASATAATKLDDLDAGRPQDRSGRQASPRSSPIVDPDRAVVDVDDPRPRPDRRRRAARAAASPTRNGPADTAAGPAPSPRRG